MHNKTQTLLVGKVYLSLYLYLFVFLHHGCHIIAHASAYVNCLFHFCGNLLAPVFYLAWQSHSSSLSQHVNHQITKQIICLCKISVQHLHVQSCYSCSNSCFPRSCMFHITATIQSYFTVHSLYIS